VRVSVAILFLAFSVVTARSQGQLVFNNRVNNVVVAPLYGLEPSDPGLAKHGNTVAGIPAGTQTYSGELLAGTGFTAQLFGGSTRAVVANLQTLLPPVTFRTGTVAGFVVAPPFTVRVPGVAEAAPANVVLRAWENRAGTITNWAQVLADPGIARGESIPFVTPPLGGAFHAPPNLIGLESFNLATGGLQRFSLKIDFQPTNAPVPLGYFADVGAIFGATGDGLSYGWNLSQAAFAKQSNSTNSSDVRYDTFIEMESNAVWEIQLPDGVYGVHAVAGDAHAGTGVFRIEAEGVPAVYGTPSTNRPWIEGDAIVEVADGRLTLSNGSGAMSNRICFLEISRLERPRLELTRLANGSITLGFSGEIGAEYAIEGSSDLVQWTELGRAERSSAGRFGFTAPPGENPYRFYRARTLILPTLTVPGALSLLPARFR
jgi:hypothetical protein